MECWVKADNRTTPVRLYSNSVEAMELKLDVIATMGNPPTRAAARATKTIPIVMTVVGQPVPRFAESLAKPGGNITCTAAPLLMWI
jgi:putative tryptophan/tyrosine transport system substrate-binding protein